MILQEKELLKAMDKEIIKLAAEKLRKEYEESQSYLESLPPEKVQDQILFNRFWRSNAKYLEIIEILEDAYLIEE